MSQTIGQTSENFLAFKLAVEKWTDCETAAQSLLDGADYEAVFDRLRDNGSWGMVPWPRDRLIAAVEKARAGIADQSAPVPFKRSPKRYPLDAVTFAIAEVLGVKQPWF